MKRLIIVWAALLWGAAGCEVHDSGRGFEPTRPGYYLFQQSYEPLCSAAADLCDILAFARYYAAETDQEREALHDALFYAQRITHNGDTWRIIDPWMEVEIATGGLPLQAEGSRWAIDYRNGYYNRKSALILGRDASAEGRYTFLPAENYGTLTGRFTVETPFVTQPLEAGIRIGAIELSITGKGHAAAHDVGIDFSIRTPLRYNSSVAYAFTAGALHLSTGEGETAETAEATLEGYNAVKIEYNGHTDTWSRNSYRVAAE